MYIYCGKLPHLFIPSKTVTLVHKFAVEDPTLGRIASLLPEFAVKDLVITSIIMLVSFI